ncbi:MAG: VCBS repeat-containing protein [Pyrinomonadaceae bacterium]|nr:VCBS repeat-containing protein [Pyrinomonadaceae bacterium]
MVKLNNNLRIAKLSAIFVAAILAFFVFYGAAFKETSHAASAGPSPSRTGAPGESNCTACHNEYALNSGSGNVRITGLPANYTPNQRIPVTVTVNQQGQTVYGFQTTSLDAGNRQAGDYILPTQTPTRTQMRSGLVGGNTRRYVGHTVDGIVPTVFDKNSWTFTWQAPATRRGKVTFYAAGNAANSDGGTGGDYIYTSNVSVCSGSVQSNFDGDGKSDITVFRPSSGTWFSLNSSNSSFIETRFGQNGDKPVAADFDGDGKNDVAVFRPSTGVWFIQKSSDGSFVATQFGQNGDAPLAGDFNGDGKSDLVIFRPSNGTWYIYDLVTNGFSVQQFGQNGDKSVSGDFDGDGKRDYAVFRPTDGTWYVLQSSDGKFIGTQFGISTDKPSSGDFDGDGKNDLAVFRPSTGVWFIKKSSDGSFITTQFGQNGDEPAPNDFDGDCKTDLAVYRNGVWYVLNSTDSSLRVEQFGLSGDVPVSIQLNQ